MDEQTPEELKEEQERKELEEKIQLLELSRINLRVTPVVFDRLNRCAEVQGQTIEEHCTEILVNSLNTQIGKPTINAPSVIGGTPQKKIMGPSGVSTVTRA